ncbi:MAG: outer membrane beta-barrel protein [Candidatus Kapaibacterium sp.]|jgi:opacity protein-like surface antigen|nr:outer membrane beta-barrel protein [Candidatus Kapabacteria bacterium]
MTKYLLFLIIAATLTAQSQNPDDYFNPFRAETWVFGISGSLSFDNFHTSYNRDEYPQLKINSTDFTINTRNGRMVSKYIAVGVDFQWDINNSTTSPDGSEEILEVKEVETLGFIGVWGRYYVPLKKEDFAVFAEVSIGYSSYSDEQRVSDGLFTSNNITDADGLGYNAGLGLSLFVTKHIAFELTGRFEAGELTGTTKTLENSQELINDFKINKQRINLLLGIQIYL